MEKETEIINALLERSTAMTEDGFSVDIASEHPAWEAAIKALGVHPAYRQMAAHLCEMYEARYGMPFLFSEDCVAYELEYHIDAFMTMQGYKGYTRNVTTLLFDRESLIRHCCAVDINVKDVADLKQRLMFGYREGVRACLRGTERDPFRDSRG